MNKVRTYILLAASVSLLFLGCSKKSSDEACQHETTMNLDQGNYDAVLSSGCADAMQRGAAYFGKAGFDIANVINRFSEANNSSSAQSPLTIYMTSLIGQPTNETLTNLDASRNEYTGVPSSAESYLDAQFNLGLVDAMKGLTLLKLVISVEGTAALDKQCDMNTNNSADGVDAVTCALLLTSGTITTCGPEYVITRVPNVTVQGSSTTYEGLITQVTGTGSALACPLNNTYYRLLYSNAGSSVLVTSTSQSCAETSPTTGRSWPCPLESGGIPLGLANSFDESLNGSISAMNTALTTTAASDVESSIRDIKQQNCCTPPETWDPDNPASCTCSAPDLAAYLQTL
jgi:hypothetical protein